MSTVSGITESPAFKLNSLTRQMRRFSLALLRSAGVDITLDQWGVLGLLYQSAGPMSQAQLADMMVKDSPTVSRILDVLCREKLVIRKANGNDRRKFELELSKLGKERVTAASPIIEEARAQLFAGISKDEFRVLDEILDRIEKNIAKGK